MIDSADNVCMHTVAQNICVGCGVCAGVCPSRNLVMSWNAEGCYLPVDGGHCLHGCRKCLDVCPFQDHEDNEDTIAAELFGATEGISHTSETGYHLGCYVGYANGGYRERGASGGLASWLLATLLERGDVDRVVCVRHNPDPDKLFAYSVLSSADEVRASSKSAYYPVEMSDVIQTILREDLRYAVIGLPCFLKALRLAMKNNALLLKRVKVTVGLVCGHLKSKGFASLITSALSREILPTSMVFRDKAPGYLASDYIVTVAFENGTQRSEMLCKIAPDIWSANRFELGACKFCDDIFAEVADMVCMDAWLPDYTTDWRGTSIVLARSKRMQHMLLKGIEREELELQPIQVGRLIESQAGLVKEKRCMISYHLWLAERDGTIVPRKRVCARRPMWMQRLCLAAREDLRAASNITCDGTDSKLLRDHSKRVRNAKIRLACAEFPFRVFRRVCALIRRLRKPIACIWKMHRV